MLIDNNKREKEKPYWEQERIIAEINERYKEYTWNPKKLNGVFKK